MVLIEFENTDIAREPLYPEGIAPELIIICGYGIRHGAGRHARPSCPLPIMTRVRLTHITHCSRAGEGGARRARGALRGGRKRSTPRRVPPHEMGREDELGARPVPRGTRVLPTRSNPNRLFAAERGRAGFVGNTSNSGRLLMRGTHGLCR